MRTIRERKAVVTGAASGIGREIALALAREGADLFLIDRDAERLASVVCEAAAHGVEVAAEVCDLTIAAAITKATDRVRFEWHDDVNILVNCAGIASYGPFHLAAGGAWRQLLAVNLLAPMQIIHELFPALLAAEEAHILNICSVFGLVPLKRFSAYQASKYGLVGFTLALRNEYHRSTFGVTALCPGFVQTPLLAELKDTEVHRQPPVFPRSILSTPEAVAVAAIAAIRYDRGLVVVPSFVRLLCSMARLFPALFDWVNREGWRRRGRIDVPRRLGRDVHDDQNPIG
jgi:3-oxoacyl-[acyl-carrier protein] reductase